MCGRSSRSWWKGSFCWMFLNISLISHRLTGSVLLEVERIRRRREHMGTRREFTMPRSDRSLQQKSRSSQKAKEKHTQRRLRAGSFTRKDPRSYQCWWKWKSRISHQVERNWRGGHGPINPSSCQMPSACHPVLRGPLEFPHKGMTASTKTSHL